jgi:heat shock protein HtpX
MGRRIFLFLLTNLAIVLTMSVVLSVLGVGQYVGPGGLDPPSGIYCFLPIKGYWPLTQNQTPEKM